MAKLNEYRKLIESGQDVFDLALQEYGNIEAIFIFLIQNDLDVEATLTQGQSLLFEKTPSVKVKDAQVMDYFRRNALRINCDDQPEGAIWITADPEPTAWEAQNGLYNQAPTQ
jgi:hypothetical protein